MFNTFGSSHGAHSDLPTSLDTTRDGRPHKRVRLVPERECEHGPVKVLVRDGVRLDKPEIIHITKLSQTQNS